MITRTLDKIDIVEQLLDRLTIDSALTYASLRVGFMKLSKKELAMLGDIVDNMQERR